MIARNASDPEASHGTSPRVSEDSYDHVSQASGVQSRTSPGTSVTGVADVQASKTGSKRDGRSKEADDEDDSDWE